jgi:predicted peroxiredoxin
MTDKYLINCAYGTDDAEKATIAFILAFASSKSSETAVFATSGAYDLFLEDKAPDIQAEGYQPINGLIDGFIENGGKVWLCPACANAKGITQDDLIHGVEIAGAPKTMAYLSEGARTLM